MLLSIASLNALLEGAAACFKQERINTSDHQEVEWQFDALDVRPVGRWLEERSHWDGLAVAGLETRELTDTYYETEDWRLYRAGYALRVRQSTASAEYSFEATMKSLTSGETLPDPGGGAKSPARSRAPLPRP